MLLASLPFDYAVLLDTTDRLRTTRRPRTPGARVRRAPSSRDKK
jgi:hypothetical protein